MTVKKKLIKLLILPIIASTITACSNNITTKNQTSQSEKSTKLTF